MNIQEITLDLSKQPSRSQLVRIGQGDSSGTTIVAAIYDNGVAATLTGMSARFCMRTPGGATYVRDSDCTVSGNEITYVVDEEHCAAVAGKTDFAYFEIVSGETVVYSTSRFRLEILRSVIDGAVPGEPYDNAIDEAIDACTTASSAANAAATNANTKAELADGKATAANNAAASANAAAADARLAADQARGAISANQRFTVAVREFHDGSQRIALVDAGEEQ